MKCENCNIEQDGSYGSGRFCSKICARSFSTKYSNNKKLKITKCKICNKEIKIKLRASSKLAVCLDCKEKSKRCKQCGRETRICRNSPERWICKKQQFFPTLNKYFGFNLDVIGTEKLFEEFERIRNLLIEDYWDNKLSIPQLVDKYNFYDNFRHFNGILNKLKINKRTLSNSIQNAILNNRFEIPPSNKYKNGWHTTWNNKNVFYRSSYELEFAQKLDEDRIDYSMEDLRILYWDSQLNKQRIAIPDFYIKDKNLIIEIKSEYTYDEINMNDKIKAYQKHGYNFELYVNKELKISNGVSSLM